MEEVYVGQTTNRDITATHNIDKQNEADLGYTSAVSLFFTGLMLSVFENLSSLDKVFGAHNKPYREGSNSVNL